MLSVRISILIMLSLLQIVWNLVERKKEEAFSTNKLSRKIVKKCCKTLQIKRCCRHMYSGQLWEVNKSCDTEPSCQAGDVLSQMLTRCWFSYNAICSKALLSPSDMAHPTKTSCSHRQCCLGSRQDMIQDVLSHCCQHISNWWHSSKHFIVFQAYHGFLKLTNTKH